MKLLATCCLLVQGLVAIVASAPVAAKSNTAVLSARHVVAPGQGAKPVAASKVTKVAAAKPAPAVAKLAATKDTKVAAKPVKAVAKPLAAAVVAKAVAAKPAAAVTKTVAVPVKRTKVDVGFASFEKSMMGQILSSISNATAKSQWSKQLQVACKENVTKVLTEGLNLQVKPLKMSIGKTWMSLAEDEEKNNYVATLKSAYDPIFEDIMKTIDDHLQRSLKNLQVHLSHQKKVSSQDELLAQCSSAVVGNILNERCYDIGGAQHEKKPTVSFLEITKPHNFCMPSVFEALVRRLKDSQGLIGMTMQFESKSASLQPSTGGLDAILR